jgi:hypothetical protein
MDLNYDMDSQIKADFTNNVKDYMELEEQISRLNVALKERKVKLKALSELIIRNMENNDIHHINIKNGALVYKSDEKFKGLNKTNLLSGLNIYFNDKQKATTASKVVMDNRDKIRKIRLKLQKFN